MIEQKKTHQKRETLCKQENPKKSESSNRRVGKGGGSSQIINSLV